MYTKHNTNRKVILINFHVVRYGKGIIHDPTHNPNDTYNIHGIFGIELCQTLIVLTILFKMNLIWFHVLRLWLWATL